MFYFFSHKLISKCVFVLHNAHKNECVEDFYEHVMLRFEEFANENFLGHLQWDGVFWKPIFGANDFIYFKRVDVFVSILLITGVGFLGMPHRKYSCNLLRTFSVLLLLCLSPLFLTYTNIWVRENECTGVGWTFWLCGRPEIYYTQVLVWILMSRFV